MPLSLDGLFRLVSYTWRRFPVVYVSLILSLLSVAIELAALSAIFPLADAASGKGVPRASFWPHALEVSGIASDLGNLLILFLLLLTLRAMTLFFSNALVNYTGRQLIAHFSSQAFTTFIRTLTFTEINRRSIGYFISLAGDEAYRASQVIVSINQLLSAFALILIYFSAIAYQSMTVAISVVLFLGFAGISLIGAFRRSHRLGAIMTEQARALGSHFLDSLNSLRSVRALTAEEYVSSHYREKLKEYARVGNGVDLTNLLARYVPAFVLLAVGLGWLISPGQAANIVENLPFLFMMLVLLLRFFPVIGDALNICLRIVADLKAGHDISHVLARATEPSPSHWIAAGTRTRLDRVKHVELRDVGFSYSDGKEVLRNVDILLEAGHSYSLAGGSGTGKSTIVDLLLRFYIPQRGVILVDGYELQKIDTVTLRSKIVVLEQQARVFNDTIYNNVAFGRQTDLAAVRKVCRLACIDEDIEKLPQGYDTLISYQGGNLSGGQRQRIAIARGLLGDGDVLILDESTNALDGQTKQHIVENIISEYKERIVVFVTHDQSLAQRVDVAFDLASINKCVPTKLAAPSGVQPDEPTVPLTFIKSLMDE